MSKEFNKTFVPNSSGYLYRQDLPAHMNFTCLGTMFGDNMLCDVTLLSDGIEIRAHKVILAMCSTYFYIKFSRDRKLGLLNRIQIDRLSYETLNAVVNYFYTSEVLVTEHNVKDLLAAAGNLAVPKLQEVCLDFLVTNLSPSNCIETWKVVKKYRCENLNMIVSDYVEKHFSEVIRFDAYLQLSCEEFVDFLDKDLSRVSETHVLDSVIEWVEFDIQRRKDHFLSLIDLVELALISHEHVIQKIDEKPWLKSNPEFMMSFIRCNAIGRQIISTKRGLSSKLLLVVGITDTSNLSMELYDFGNSVWLQGPAVVNKKLNGYARIAIHGTNIYCIDKGSLSYLDISSCPSQMVWTPLCDQISQIGTDFGIATVNDSIYVVGGHDGGYLASTKKLNVISRDWKIMQNMNEGRAFFGMNACRGNLYVAGGNTNNCSKSVNCYRPSTDSWHSIPPMTVGRQSPGVGALEEKIFVIGGCSNQYLKEVEVLDTANQTWTRYPDMNEPRNNPGVIALNSQLYVIGGYNSTDNYLKSVEVYDAKSNTWTMLPRLMHTGKEYVQAALIDKSSIKF